MAGKQARRQGINSSIIAKDASNVLGGEDSGRLDLAQGGGTQVEKLPEALKKAEETTKNKKSNTGFADQNIQHRGKISLLD